ncbi:unnamed protein product, partial [marine sediment metagenome]
LYLAKNLPDTSKLILKIVILKSVFCQLSPGLTIVPYVGAYVDANYIDTNVYIDVNQDGNHTYDVWIRDNAGWDTNVQYYGLLSLDAPEILSIDNNGLPWHTFDFNVLFNVNFEPTGES